MHEQISNFKREKETIKKDPKETTEMKNMISKLKSLFNGLNIKFDIAEEQISELKHKSIKSIQTKTKSEIKRKRKKNSGIITNSLENM